MHYQCSHVREVHDFKKQRTKFEHRLWACIGDVCVCVSVICMSWLQLLLPRLHDITQCVCVCVCVCVCYVASGSKD